MASKDCPMFTKLAECPYGSKLVDCPYLATMKNCPPLIKGCPYFAKSTGGCPFFDKKADKLSSKGCPVVLSKDKCPNLDKIEKCPYIKNIGNCTYLKKACPFLKKAPADCGLFKGKDLTATKGAAADKKDDCPIFSKMAECPHGGSKLKDCPYFSKMKECPPLAKGCPFFGKSAGLCPFYDQSEDKLSKKGCPAIVAKNDCPYIPKIKSCPHIKNIGTCTYLKKICPFFQKDSLCLIHD